MDKLPFELLTMVADHLDNLPSLLHLSQTCRTLRFFFGGPIGEGKFVRLGRKIYPAFFDKALMYGRIQIVPVKHLPRYDLKAKKYVNIPSVQWLDKIMKKEPVENTGPGKIYLLWRTEFYVFLRNYSMALSWIARVHSKTRQERIIRPLYNADNPGWAKTYLENYLTGYFDYQIFTRLFGSGICVAPIEEGFDRCTAGKTRSATTARPFDLLQLDTSERGRLRYQVIPAIRRYPFFAPRRGTFRTWSRPLNVTESVSEPFETFFDWLLNKCDFPKALFRTKNMQLVGTDIRSVLLELEDERHDHPKEFLFSNSSLNGEDFWGPAQFLFDPLAMLPWIATTPKLQTPVWKSPIEIIKSFDAGGQGILSPLYPATASFLAVTATGQGSLVEIFDMMMYEKYIYPFPRPEGEA